MCPIGHPRCSRFVAAVCRRICGVTRLPIRLKSGAFVRRNIAQYTSAANQSTVPATAEVLACGPSNRSVRKSFPSQISKSNAKKHGGLPRRNSRFLNCCLPSIEGANFAVDDGSHIRQCNGDLLSKL